jgi:acyl-CoA thioesterase-1
MLDKVAENQAMMQADGIHPNAQAQPQVMENIWTGLKPLLTKK